jgi:hypothetical protein
LPWGRLFFFSRDSLPHEELTAGGASVAVHIHLARRDIVVGLRITRMSGFERHARYVDADRRGKFVTFTRCARR